MIDKIIDFQKGKIKIYHGGIEAGFPLLFLHGNSLGAFTFEKQFRGKLATKYKLAALDFPGHGGSLRTSYTATIFTETVEAALTHLGWEDVILVGHSFGGHVAIRALARLTNVRGVFVFGTPPVGVPPALDQIFLPNPVVTEMMGKETFSDSEAIEICKTLTAEDTCSQQWAEALKGTDGRFRTEGVANFIGASVDELSLIENCTFPVALAFGESESLCNIDYVKALNLKNLWQNKIHLIPDGGHCPQYTRPEAFDELLTSYCADVTDRLH